MTNRFCAFLLIVFASSVYADQGTSVFPINQAMVPTDVKLEVVYIDHANKAVTFKSPIGRIVTMRIESNVGDLKDFEAGDRVFGTYQSTIDSIREPINADKQNPWQVVEAQKTVASGVIQPSAGIARRYTALCAVLSVDENRREAKLRDSAGIVYKIANLSAANLQQLQRAQEQTLEFTEALATRMNKAPS